MVLQRDKSNQATVYISGSFSELIDKVEIQFRALNGGRTSDWITISDNPEGGYFSGNVTWTAGWYTLEARGIFKGQVVSTSSIYRFGIGDVFLISGQSNAQGFFQHGAQSAADDRVNCINYYNGNSHSSELPNPEFSHLDANSFISPRGNSSWAWGSLGDKITSQTGFPVLFYNVAWYSSGSANWRESINGTTLSEYDRRTPFEPSGMPFGNLRSVMKYYVPITGLRAVLWQQGETDNLVNTPKELYTNNLRTVINQIRQEINKDVSWVIARSTYDDERGANNNIIGAQNEVIASVTNVFQGPETDNIQVPRPDGLHFYNEGLIQLGEAWGNSLNDHFWSQSNPLQAVEIPTLTVSCQSDNSLRLSINGSYSSIQWNNNQNAQTIQVGGGSFTAKVQDFNGNVLYLPPFYVPDVRKPQTPEIVPDRSTNLCQGESVALNVIGVNNGFSWNSGQTSDRIEVNQDGDFFVTNRNGFGCVSTSNVINVRVFTTPPPAQPTVLISGPTTFCENVKVDLSVIGDLSKVWSTGETASTIAIQTSGIYKVRVVDSNGCSSPESEEVEITVNPLPATPVVTLDGQTTICDGTSISLHSNYSTGNIWNTEAKESSISVTTAGSYFVKVQDSNGCVSLPSRTIDINVLPAPPVPNLVLNGPTVFCEGETVTMTASGAESILWSDGSTSTSILVNESGTFSARAVSKEGCFSPASVVINTEVKAVPTKPLISKIGTYTLEATHPERGLIFYEWRREDVVLPNSINKLKTIEGGNYSVRTYEISDNGEQYCVSPISESFLYTLDLSNKGLSIYPNPTLDRMITVETFQAFKEAWVDLYDLSGQRLQSYSIKDLSGQVPINLGNITPGIYIIKVSSEQFVATQKVVIE